MIRSCVINRKTFVVASSVKSDLSFTPERRGYEPFEDFVARVTEYANKFQTTMNINFPDVNTAVIVYVYDDVGE